jgi:hypothetical protein
MSNSLIQFTNTIIQLKNHTQAEWEAENPILEQGEMGIESDTLKMKVGDGSTAWNNLSYLVGSGSNTNFKYGYYTLSNYQTSNLATGNHVELDTSFGTLGGLSTGTGQEKGIITLTGGKTYKISANAAIIFSDINGYGSLHIFDRTNNVMIGSVFTYNLSVSSLVKMSSNENILVFVHPETDINIDLRIGAGSSMLNITKDHSWLFIEEYPNV